LSDHWRWVSTPRWARTSANVTSTCHLLTNHARMSLGRALRSVARKACEDGGAAGDFDEAVGSESEGMGMGLSICRSIIESYGGRLFATANHPCGLIMHTSLPTGAAHDALAVAKEAVE
jgi:hypothetical protein